MDLPGYEPAFDEPEQVRALLERHASYPAIPGYQSDRCTLPTAQWMKPAAPRSRLLFPGSFHYRFRRPLPADDRQARDHVWEPVLAGSADSLVQHKPSGIFIVTQLAPDERFDGPPGF